MATLEQKIIELSDKLSTSTNKALSLKRAKKIKEAKKELRTNLKPLKRRLSILRVALNEKNEEAEKWTDEEKSEILKIQPSHLRVAPPIIHCTNEDILKKYKVLYNFVYAENDSAIKWLKSLGFTFIQYHEHYGMQGKPFYEFLRIA